MNVAKVRACKATRERARVDSDIPVMCNEVETTAAQWRLTSSIARYLDSVVMQGRQYLKQAWWPRPL